MGIFGLFSKKREMAQFSWLVGEIEKSAKDSLGGEKREHHREIFLG